MNIERNKIIVEELEVISKDIKQMMENFENNPGPYYEDVPDQYYGRVEGQKEILLYITTRLDNLQNRTDEYRAEGLKILFRLLSDVEKAVHADDLCGHIVVEVQHLIVEMAVAKVLPEDIRQYIEAELEKLLQYYQDQDTDNGDEHITWHCEALQYAQNKVRELGSSNLDRS